MANADQLTITLELASGSITHGLHVEDIQGSEAISTLYRYTVRFSSLNAIDPEAVVGEKAKVTIETPAGQHPVSGVVTEFSNADAVDERRFSYTVVIEPSLSVLTLMKQNQIYGTQQKVTAKDIIDGEIKGTLAHGGEARAIEADMILTASYPEREYMVQYNETDFAFLSRICEHYGIFYYFRQGSGSETVVFGDSNVAFVDAVNSEGTDKYPYRRSDSLDLGSTASITALNFTVRPVPQKVMLREYNYETPTLELKSEASVSQGKAGAVIEYAQNFKTLDEGNTLAQVRAEELACRHKIFRGRSNAPQLRAGSIIRLEGHPKLDNRYLIISVEHTAAVSAPEGFTQDATEEVGAKPYANSFTCIAFDVPFRPMRVTPKPIAAGLSTAHVDGAGTGQRAEIDDQGRYKVRVRYDEAGNPDGSASEFVRKAEPYAGPSDTGLHFPLLKGTEVAVAFVNGDIDRPIIVGAVPNPVTPNVVASNNFQQNRLRSPSGGLFEIFDAAAP